MPPPDQLPRAVPTPIGPVCQVIAENATLKAQLQEGGLAAPASASASTSATGPLSGGLGAPAAPVASGSFCERVVFVFDLDETVIGRVSSTALVIVCHSYGSAAACVQLTQMQMLFHRSRRACLISMLVWVRWVTYSTGRYWSAWIGQPGPQTRPRAHRATR